jgi:S-formylglutathione hydrolase FrmB
MKPAVVLLRAALIAILGLCLWTAVEARAQSAVEHVMVPSAAMGRDSSAGGEHGWSTWAPQLAAMSGDLTASIR